MCIIVLQMMPLKLKRVSPEQPEWTQYDNVVKVFVEECPENANNRSIRDQEIKSETKKSIRSSELEGVDLN